MQSELHTLSSLSPLLHRCTPLTDKHLLFALVLALTFLNIYNPLKLYWLSLIMNSLCIQFGSKLLYILYKEYKSTKFKICFVLFNIAMDFDIYECNLNAISKQISWYGLSSRFSTLGTILSRIPDLSGWEPRIWHWVWFLSRRQS